MMNLIEKLKLFVFYFAVISGTLLLSGGMTTSQAPAPPIIILPDAPSPPSPPPPPAPSPSTPTKLGSDVLFMVRSDSDCIVLASPQGVLKATREVGPLRIRARFSDNPDKIETRKFLEKNLWIIEAARTGTVELITWPIGGTEKDVQRRLIECLVGPLPPPIPPNPPTPPEPTPTVGKLRVLIVVDKLMVAKLPVGQQLILNLPKELRDYINGHCGTGPDGKTPEFRVLDKDNDVSNESAAWQAGFAKTAGKTMPYIVIANETASFDGPLPATLPEMLTLLKKYGGN